MMVRGTLGAYLRRAFLTQWNLLFFLGGTVAAGISPWPDALIPLVLAGEVAFLTALVSRPRFRTAVDAQLTARAAEERKGAGKVKGKGKGGQTAPGVATLADLVAGLSASGRERFGRLRARCLEMQRIAQGAQGQVSGSDRGDDLRGPALDRLLWMFLRLLLARQALSRFLDSTEEEELTRQLESARSRFQAVGEGDDERVRTSLQDSIAVAELRLDNYRKAEKNAEFMDLELDRIEGKIQALVEMAVIRQDPDFLTSQVDAAAESVRQTEGTMRELQSITGLSDILEEPPPILAADLGDTVGNEA